MQDAFGRTMKVGDKVVVITGYTNKKLEAGKVSRVGYTDRTVTVELFTGNRGLSPRSSIRFKPGHIAVVNGAK